MFRNFVMMFCFALSFDVLASGKVLSSFTLPDQHEKSATVDENTKILVFAKDKKGYMICNDP